MAGPIRHENSGLKTIDPKDPSLVIKINPEAPRSWDLILAEARQFIECKAHPSEDLEPWTSRESSFKYPSEEETFRSCHFERDYMHSNTPPPRNDNSMAIDHISKLTYELKLMIIEHTVAPIELEAGFRTPPHNGASPRDLVYVGHHEYYNRYNTGCRLIDLKGSTPPIHLQIYGYQSWNHIPFYYLNRAWRAIAVAKYGEPTKSGIPFDPLRDSLRVSAQEETAAICDPRAHSGEPELKLTRCFDPGARTQSRRVKRDSVVAYRRLGSKHGVKILPYGKMDWGKPKPLCLDSTFMTRVRNLVIDIRFPVHVKDEDCQYTLDCPKWKLLINMATKFFTNATHVRVDTLELDHCQCLYSSREAHDDIFPNNAEPLSEEVAIYNPPELWFFDSLDTAAAEKSHLRERLFPQLEHFEVLKTHTFCTAHFSKRYYRHFNAVFHAGKTPTLLKAGSGTRTVYKDPQVDDSEFDGPWYDARIPQFYPPNN